MTDFDPYFQWLGIAPEEKSPDHYRLLGLRRFEGDLAVIQAAADQRMGVVRAYQMGPRGPLTQKLLNELAAAKLCLLNPDSKAEYDAALANATAGEVAVADTMLPTAVPDNSAAAVSSFPPSIPPSAAYAVPGDHFPSDSLADEFETASSGWWFILLGMILTAVVGVSVWIVKELLDRRGATAVQVPAEIQESETQKDFATAESATDPALIMQEASGFVHFPMTVAKLSGNAKLESHDVGDLLVDWDSEEDTATWRFKVVKLPSQGIFRVRVNYQADAEAAGAQFVLSIDGEEQTRDVLARGHLLDDEFYLAVKRSGEHLLQFSVRNLAPNATFGLKLLELSVPRRNSPAQ